jgi:hypothetical protein
VNFILSMLFHKIIGANAQARPGAGEKTIDTSFNVW